MWLLQIRELKKNTTYQQGEYKESILPLKHGKTYNVGRQENAPVRKGERPENDIIIRTNQIYRRAAHIQIAAWNRDLDKEDGLSCPQITFFLDPQAPDVDVRKAVDAWYPMRELLDDSLDETDYSKTSETNEFLVRHGMVVHLADLVKLRFIWKPVILSDVDCTAPRAVQYAYLNEFMIFNSQEFVPRRTTTVIKREISPADKDCLLAVSNNVPIVSPDWLNELQARLKQSQEKKGQKDVFELPAAKDFYPSVDSNVDDERKKASWWLPDPARKSIWKGKTVIMLGGKSPISEEKYFRYLGANTRRMDILSHDKRTNNMQEFIERAKPEFAEAERYFKQCLSEAQATGENNQDWTKEKQHVAIALADGLVETYETANIPLSEAVMKPLEESGIPLNFADNWWLSLTKANWRNFTMSAHHNQETASESQSQSGALAETNDGQESDSVPAKPTNEQSAGIPSTHPEEQEPSQQSGQMAPLRLRLKQGRRPFSLLESDSDDDDEDANRPSKRRRAKENQRQIVAKTLAKDSAVRDAAQSLSETQKTNASGGSGLKLRAGKGRLGLLDNINEDDSDSNSDDAGKSVAPKRDTLHVYRDLYNSVKQTSGGTSQGQQGNEVETPEEEDDFVQRSIMRQKKEAEMASQALTSTTPNRGHDGDEDMGDNTPQQSLLTRQAEKAEKAPRQPLHTQHVEPTRPEEVTKDTEFLQAVTKARKGANQLDDFDLEFNALKIARPKKNSATKIYGTGLFDASRIYNSVLDLDSDVTGNFIKIERIDLFRKDKGKQRDQAVNQDWAGRPNFKKFKKQEVSRHAPVKLNLAPAADYGIGLDYWPDRKKSNGDDTTDLPLHSQARATQSQASAQTARPAASSLARPKRNLLRIESDDDTSVMALPTLTRDATGALVTQSRAGRSSSTTTRNSAAPTSRQGSSSTIGRGMRDAASSNLLAVESDEDEQPVRKTRRIATNARGAATQTEDRLGSPNSSYTASAASSTNKRKRLVPMDDDDDDDGMIFPGLRRKKR